TNAYQKINDQKNQINPFFILSYLAQKNGYILNPDINERYGIIINYAYCVQAIRKDLDKAKILYEEALTLIEKEAPLHIEEFKIFPLLQISEIEIQRRNYSEAEFLFREIKELGNKVDGDEFFLNYFLIHGRYSLQIGDHFTANQLFIEAYEYYLTTDLPH